MAVVDLAYRGVNRHNPHLIIIHRDKAKSLGEPQRKPINGLNGFEPVIGHLKTHQRMSRCHLKGGIGDSMHAMLGAIGCELRSLLRAIASEGL